MWDGLAAHRGKLMRAWLGGSGPGWWWSRWPATPELNPVGPLWASLNGTELANLAGDTLEEIIAAAERGIRGSGPPRTCRFRSCATADCPYGENRLTGTATFFGLAHAGSL
jgi:hypothetical protein